MKGKIIIILKNVNTLHQFWKLAKIEEFIESSDEVVQSVVICLAVYRENDNDNILDYQNCEKERRLKRNSYYW